MWTPYLTLSVVEEFDGDHGYVINNTFYGSTNTEGTSGMLELGFNARHDAVSRTYVYRVLARRTVTPGVCMSSRNAVMPLPRPDSITMSL